MGLSYVVDVEVYGASEAVREAVEAVLGALEGASGIDSASLPAEDGWIWSATFRAASRGEQLHAWNVIRSALAGAACASRVTMHECRPGESCRNETYREWRKGGEGGR